jgi:hypothetical protein
LSQWRTNPISIKPDDPDDPALVVVDKPNDVVRHSGDGRVEGVGAVVEGVEAHVDNFEDRGAGPQYEERGHEQQDDEDEHDAAAADLEQRVRDHEADERLDRAGELVVHAKGKVHERGEPDQANKRAPVHAHEADGGEHRQNGGLDDESQHGIPRDGAQRQACDDVDERIGGQQLHGEIGVKAAGVHHHHDCAMAEGAAGVHHIYRVGWKRGYLHLYFGPMYVDALRIIARRVHLDGEVGEHASHVSDEIEERDHHVNDKVDNYAKLQTEEDGPRSSRRTRAAASSVFGRATGAWCVLISVCAGCCSRQSREQRNLHRVVMTSRV